MSKKILIISDAWKPQINGVVRTYEYLSEELENAGHQVHVIGPSDFPRHMKMPGYDEIKLTSTPYLRLRRMIEDFSPDYLHIATEGPLGWAARRYAKGRDLTYTTAYHTQFPIYFSQRVAKVAPPLEFWSRQRATDMIRRFHAPSKGVIITTPSMKEELEALNFKMPLHTMPRGVPVNLFSPGKAELFEDLPRPIALYVGRVSLEKNLEAFLSMDWEGSKIIVGEGSSRTLLEKKYPQAHFIGKKVGQDLAACYRSSDVFVFPSKTDTFGIVLIEALASGLPVAAHDVTGPRDIITHPYLGHLHEDLSIAAHEALRHKDKAQHRHEYVMAHYTWPAVARQFMEILQEVGSIENNQKYKHPLFPLRTALKRQGGRFG